MGNLTCPKCKGRLLANPLGRWFAKFRCGHCSTLLQFDRRTNMLGMLGSISFAVIIAAIVVHGYAAIGGRNLFIAVGAWLTLMFLSYWLRGVVQDNG
jgi:hypothetical protein